MAMHSNHVKVDLEDVLSIYDAVISKFGGLYGIRDSNLLRSAVEMPFQTYEGEKLYPSLVDKAVCYVFAFAKNHPFVDGNKRMAAAVLGVFLRINGVRFKPKHTDFLNAIIGVADGSVDKEDLARWIEQEII